MPNDAVDMDSWASSACYPRRTFYPLIDGPSTRDHRVTMTDFRLCSSCQTRSQAGFCHCTLRLISDQPEPTIARLRYSLGGDRPSQTTHLTLSSNLLKDQVRIPTEQGWYFNDGSTMTSVTASKPPTYATHAKLKFNIKL